MLLANMSLFPKPQKDHALPQNYRPISVINNDLNFFIFYLYNRETGPHETPQQHRQ